MLSDKIKSLRLEKGLSQEDFANKLSVVRQTVSKWEKGLSVPNSDMIINIADVLGTTVSQLLDEQKSQEPPKHQNHHKALILTLIIIGFPVWFSILIAAFSVVLSLYLSIWSVIISLWAVFGSFVIAAFGGTIIGLNFTFGGNIPSGLATIGAALILLGLSVFTFYGCKFITKHTVSLTKKMALWFWSAFVKKGANNG